MPASDSKDELEPTEESTSFTVRPSAIQAKAMAFARSIKGESRAAQVRRYIDEGLARDLDPEVVDKYFKGQAAHFEELRQEAAKSIAKPPRQS